MHSDRVSTTGSESRKSSKPAMEKKRRARINASLAELKSLLLEVIKKEGARHSKMEKADILEMAVKHLRQVQRQQYTSGGADPTLSDKYRLGFNECAQEVSRYLGAADDDDAELRARLLNHLANCITSSDSPSPLSTPSSSPALGGHVSSSGSVVGSGGGVVTPVAPIPVRPVSAKPGSVSALSLIPQGDPGGSPPSAAAAAVLVPTTEINNNVVTLANNNSGTNNIVSSAGDGGLLGGAELRGVSHQLTLPTATSSAVGGRKVMGEVQVVGTKAGGGGEVALVLPANVMTGGPLPSYIIPLYASPHPLPTASLALTPNNAPQPSAGALPIPLPVMATATTPAVSAPGNAPSLVTLTPGAALSPAVLPPSSVGHVIATGLNGPLAWQTATPVYSASLSSATSSPSSAIQASSAGLTGLSPSLAASSVTSEMRPSEDRVSSSVSFCQEKSPQAAVMPQSAVASVICAPPAADRPEASSESGDRLSLLHSQLIRPHAVPAPPAVGGLPAVDGSVWRPWW